MRPSEIFLPVFALFGLAVVAPAWMFWLGEFTDFPVHIQFLAGAILPIGVLLFAASWLEPR
jgi:hypothetical protein